jgi:c-di-GMP-binding flagellar brake protein YcgR
MGIFRRLFRPRSHPRFYTSKGVVVVIGPYAAGGREIQLLDLSEGGCAFVYKGTKEELKESGILSLVADNVPCLDRIDFHTASDRPLSDSDQKAGWLRRRGLQFKWIGAADKKRLKAFIEENSIGRAS